MNKCKLCEIEKEPAINEECKLCGWENIPYFNENRDSKVDEFGESFNEHKANWKQFLEKYTIDEIRAMRASAPPFKCKMCGIFDIEHDFQKCEVCGWTEDMAQQDDPDFEGGTNELSFNQHRKTWEANKEKIKNHDGSKKRLVEKLFKEQGGRRNDGSEFLLDHEYPKTPPVRFKNPDGTWIDEQLTPHEIEKTRKKELIARSEFPSVGKYRIPLIKKQDIDVSKIDVMGYVRAKVGDTENTHKTLHFVTHDWNFETVWSKPDASMEKLGQYHALCSPDFSLYWDMPLALQINNTFRNRWCGAYWQSLGAKVIPTIAWGDEKTWEFCFDGVEQGSVVFVATYMTRYPDRWLAGYKKMLEVIKPSAVIVYGDKIPGMNTQNVTFISPYDTKEGVDKLGVNEYAKRFFAGEVYPK